MLAELGRDVMYAVRVLRKDVGFTAVAVLTLALGIGANTTVFSLVEAVLNFPIPADDPGRITAVYGENPARGRRSEGVSVDEFLDWRAQARSFEWLVALSEGDVNVAGTAEPVRVPALRVSQGFFALMGRPPVHGRAFRTQEMTAGNDRVAVLNHGFWQTHFGGDPRIVGEEISIDGEPWTVVGIAPQGFGFLPDTELWMPLVLEPGRSPRDDRSLFALGRLRDGVGAAEATAEMDTIARRIAEIHPDTNAGWSARVVTLRDDLISDAGFAMVVFYGAISIVLLIACANVANLLLSRASVREREIALRAALGARRLRVLRQLLTESIVLSIVGGVLGLILAVWGISVLRSALAPDPSMGFVANEIALNQRVFGHALAVTLLAGAVFGVVPALRASRPNLDETLKQGARGSSGGARQHVVRNGLVVAQMALALALLSAAGSLVWAFQQVYTSAPGFNPGQLLTFRLTLPEATYGSPERLSDFEREARERLLRIPGTRSVATTSVLPLTLPPAIRTARVVLPGGPQEAHDESLNAIHLVVSPSFWKTMEIPFLEGRPLSEQDRQGSLAVAVVNQTLAKRYWPEESPLGRRFKLAAPGMETPWLTVVGVASDVQTTAHSLRHAGAVPNAYLPFEQSPRREFSVAIRTDGEPLSLATQVRDTVGRLDRTLPLDHLATAEQVIAVRDTQNRTLIRVLFSLAVIALVLAGVGIYGVISYSVHQRTREIGVRVALGARPGNILLVVLRQAAILSGLGFVIGLGAAVAIVRFLASELEGLGAANAAGPATFVAVSLVLLAVSQVASFIPARRAVRIDPVSALRVE